MNNKRSNEDQKLGTIKVRKGIFSKALMDCSAEYSVVAKTYAREALKAANQTVEESFTLSGDYQKYEFYEVPTKPMVVKEGDTIVELALSIEISIIYILEKAFVVYAKTCYLYAPVEGCSKSADVFAKKDNNYSCDQVFYNKVTSLKITHDEKKYTALTQSGCSGQTENEFKFERTGLLIRCGENFPLFTSDHIEELKDCRKILMEKMDAAQ